MKSNQIPNIKHGFIKINSFLVLWLAPSRLLSFPSSLNPKPFIRPGKPWPTPMPDHLMVTSNKSKNNSNKHPRDLSQSPNICRPLKLKLTNLLYLANRLTMKISLRKSWRALMMIINPIIDAVNVSDTPISFDELHEKLINKELSLRQKNNSSPLPATTNPTHAKSISGNNKNHSSRPSWNPSSGPIISSPSTN